MVSYFQVVVLAANAVALIYYGGKWVVIRSLHRKIEASHEVALTLEDLGAHTGGYVFITGMTKALNNPLKSKYSDAVTAVVQNIQKIKHQLVRIGGFWVRKREILESVQCHHGRIALTNAVGSVQVDLRDPLWGLNQATKLDLFTGYRNVSWPVSNIFHDKFILNPEQMNPFKVLLNGVHTLGVQETESLILEGGYLSALGELRVKGDQYSVLVDVLTACDRNMLLKKVSDIRSELATKLVIFGAIALVLTAVIFSQRKSEDDDDNEF